MDRMGLGYEDCRAAQPAHHLRRRHRLRRDRPVRAQGRPGRAGAGDERRDGAQGRPVACRSPIYPTALADYSAGMHMVQGILLALLQREQTGVGQKISVSLYNSMLAMQMQEAAMILMRDREVNWAAMPLSGVFETTDGALVLVGAFKANPLRDICAALELPDLSLDARFANLEQQFAHKAELQAHVPRALRDRQPRDHWLARLEAQDLLCAPVRDMREALVDPQTRAQRDGDGRPRPPAARAIASSPARSRCRPRRSTLRRVPPRLGEHTDEVLAEAAAGAAKGAAHERAASRSPTTSRRVTIDRPEVLNAIDLATEAELQRIWSELEQRTRRARGRADRRRRARVLRRRRHEESVGQAAWNTGPRRGPAASAASRLRDTPEPAGDRPRQRLRARRRLRDGARLRHRRRLRAKPASACPSRWSGGCRSTAA